MDNFFPESFFFFMTTRATIVAVVQDKVFPFGATPTKRELPYITFQTIDNLHVHHQGGPSGLANPRLQIDMWHTSQSEAAKLSDIVRKELDGFRGTMGQPSAETEIRLIAIDSDNEEFDPLGDGAQQGAHRVQADYFVWFKEDI